MDTVLKISYDYTPETCIAQFINPIDLKFSDELVNTGNLGFRISLSDQQIFSIVETRKVALYAIEEGQDRFLWSGYISDIRNDFGYAVVTCSDEKDWLRNKMCFGSLNWTSVNVQIGITALLTEINNRRGPNEGLLTLETDVGTTIIEKKFNLGTSAFDILKQICEVLTLEFKVLFNKITVKTTIGIDRSVNGANYKQFIWNKDSPNENDITRFQNSRSIKDIGTHVVGKGSGGTATIAGDKSVFGSIERSVAMDDGNINTQTTAYVAKHEKSQVERDFDVIVTDEEAREMMVGDLVPVKIIHGSVLVDTAENLKVIQRNFIFENKKPTVTIKFATFAKEVNNMQNFLADLNRRVKRFELY